MDVLGDTDAATKGKPDDVQRELAIQALLDTAAAYLRKCPEDGGLTHTSSYAIFPFCGLQDVAADKDEKEDSGSNAGSVVGVGGRARRWMLSRRPCRRRSSSTRGSSSSSLPPPRSRLHRLMKPTPTRIRRDTGESDECRVCVAAHWFLSPPGHPFPPFPPLHFVSRISHVAHFSHGRTFRLTCGFEGACTRRVTHTRVTVLRLTIVLDDN